MAAPEPILECVPNLSEGRDPSLIQAFADLISAQPGVALLHVDPSPSANRTVFSFAGKPTAVVEAAFKLIRMASQRIDMRQQMGIHPRIGATDVCPLVPLGSLSMAEAVDLSLVLGRRVGEELGIPVYLYEHSSHQAHRKSLPQIRKGEYEALESRVGDVLWAPDFGPPLRGGTSSGATVIGARDLLVAFNMTLDTQSVEMAKNIAGRLRESGMRMSGPQGSVRQPGQFPKLRAIGWYQEDFGRSQVSMNFLDYRLSSPWKVWLACKKLAKDCGVELLGSELIGLIPKAALWEAGEAYWKEIGTGGERTDEQYLEAGVENLKLRHLKPFSVQDRVLEYNLMDKGMMI